MKIVSDAVRNDLARSTPLRIDLGSGRGRKAGYYALDRASVDEPVDIVADLNEPLDLLPDDSVGEVHTAHVLEHVTNLVGLMEELHRVVRPGGRIDIRVPHFSNPYHYSDPTHVRFFGAFSFYYFASEANQPRFRKVPSFYSKYRFVVEEVRITLLLRSSLEHLFFPRLQAFINRSDERRDMFERRLCRLFPADEILFSLRPDK